MKRFKVVFLMNRFEYERKRFQKINRLILESNYFEEHYIITKNHRTQQTLSRIESHVFSIRIVRKTFFLELERPVKYKYIAPLSKTMKIQREIQPWSVFYLHMAIFRRDCFRKCKLLRIRRSFFTFRHTTSAISLRKTSSENSRTIERRKKTHSRGCFHYRSENVFLKKKMDFKSFLDKFSKEFLI